MKLLARGRYSPIGVDIGARSVKLVQFDAELGRLSESARWDLPVDRALEADAREEAVVAALVQARQGRNFKGRQAVFSLGGRELFVQNIRVPQSAPDDMQKVVYYEAASRIPFGAEEAEIRYIEAADVRQGDSVRREVILLACHRDAVRRTIALAERAGLTPAAIDVEPAALLRCYARQFRRDEDHHARMMFVNVGATTSTVVIGRGDEPLFIKYIAVGGRQFDEAVAKHLSMEPAAAAALRKHDGDRRADQRDPEVVQSIAEAIRPVCEQLLAELSMCVRYYSVTFRGQPLKRLVVSGGEATQGLVDWLGGRLDVPCELGNPLRSYQAAAVGRASQWDVAAGLAMRSTN